MDNIENDLDNSEYDIAYHYNPEDKNDYLLDYFPERKKPIIYEPTEDEKEDIMNERMSKMPIYTFFLLSSKQNEPFYSVPKYTENIHVGEFKLLDFKMIGMYGGECDECGTGSMICLLMKLFHHEQKHIFAIEISFFLKYVVSRWSKELKKHTNYKKIYKKFNPITYILPRHYVDKKMYDSKYLSDNIYTRLSNIITNHFVSHIKDLAYGKGPDLHSITIIDIINDVYVDLNLFKKYIGRLPSESTDFMNTSYFLEDTIPKEEKTIQQNGSGISNYELYKINKANYHRIQSLSKRDH